MIVPAVLQHTRHRRHAYHVHSGRIERPLVHLRAGMVEEVTLDILHDNFPRTFVVPEQERHAAPDHGHLVHVPAPQMATEAKKVMACNAERTSHSCRSGGQVTGSLQFRGGGAVKLTRGATIAPELESIRPHRTTTDH